jgi:hypothetical protein
MGTRGWASETIRLPLGVCEVAGSDACLFGRLTSPFGALRKSGQVGKWARGKCGDLPGPSPGDQAVTVDADPPRIHFLTVQPVRTRLVSIARRPTGPFRRRRDGALRRKPGETSAAEYDSRQEDQGSRSTVLASAGHDSLARCSSSSGSHEEFVRRRSRIRQVERVARGRVWTRLSHYTILQLL